MVDEFILYDDMQYTKRDWRNRNKIKTAQGLTWLSIPVDVKGKYHQTICETKIADKNWSTKHWSKICQNYSKSKYFNEYKGQFEELYLASTDDFLSSINYRFITAVNEILGINTPIRWSSEFNLEEGRTERLLGICKQCDAKEYFSGASARVYFDEELAKKENIIVHWLDYSGYKEYTQLFPPFEHGVSILDLIFNEGPDASKFMNSFSDEQNQVLDSNSGL